MTGGLYSRRNLALHFAANSCTPASLSQFLGAREPFCGRFFNPHKQCVGLPIAEIDKYCSLSIILRKKSYKKLLKQICFNENPTQIPAFVILHVAVLVMTGYVMDFA